MSVPEPFKRNRACLVICGTKQDLTILTSKRGFYKDSENVIHDKMPELFVIPLSRKISHACKKLNEKRAVQDKVHVGNFGEKVRMLVLHQYKNSVKNYDLHSIVGLELPNDHCGYKRADIVFPQGSLNRRSSSSSQELIDNNNNNIKDVNHCLMVTPRKSKLPKLPIRLESSLDTLPFSQCSLVDNWNTPNRKLQESPQKAAIREWQEETDIEFPPEMIPNIRLLGIVGKKTKMFIYVAFISELHDLKGSSPWPDSAQKISVKGKIKIKRRTSVHKRLNICKSSNPFGELLDCGDNE